MDCTEQHFCPFRHALSGQCCFAGTLEELREDPTPCCQVAFGTEQAMIETLQQD